MIKFSDIESGLISEQWGAILKDLGAGMQRFVKDSFKKIINDLAKEGKEITMDAIRATDGYRNVYKRTLESAAKLALDNSIKPELKALANKNIEELTQLARTNPELKTILDQTAVGLNTDIRNELAGVLRDEKGALTKQNKPLSQAAKAGSVDAAEMLRKNQKLQQSYQNLSKEISAGRIGLEGFDSIEKLIMTSTSETIKNGTKSWAEGAIHYIMDKLGKMYGVNKTTVRQHPWRSMRKVTVRSALLVWLYDNVVKRIGLGNLVVLGGIGYGIYALLHKLHAKHIQNDEAIEYIDENGNSLTPEGIEQTVRKSRQSGASGTAACLQELIGKNIGKSGTAQDGRQYVWVEKTAGYPWGSKEADSQGGIVFYSDGTLISGNGAKTGTWDCSSMQLQEIALMMLDEKRTIRDILNSIRIKWSQPKQAAQQYVLNNNFPFKYGYKNDRIREMQVALGFEPKYQTGNLGPITWKALQNAGYNLSGGVTQEIYTNVLQKYNAQFQKTQPAQQETQPAQQQVQPTQQRQVVQPIQKIPTSQIKIPNVAPQQQTSPK